MTFSYTPNVFIVEEKRDFDEKTTNDYNLHNLLIILD